MEEEQEDQTWKNPLRIMLALILVLVLLATVVPYYGIMRDPTPQRIPEVSEVVTRESFNFNTTNSLTEYARADPEVKYTANRIVSLACNSDKICHAKAIYYFMRDRVNYVSDPQNHEFIEHPLVTITSGGDCESGSIAMAALMESVGIDAQLVLVKGHAYVRIKLEDAPRRYQNNGWVYLDWTCTNCGFGEIPWENWEKNHHYIEVP